MFEAPGFPEEPSDDGIDPSNGLPWMPRHLGWLCGTQRERLEWLLAEPPSSDTVVAMEAIGQEPMEPAERMIYAAVCEKHESAFTARSMQAQLDATRPTPGTIFNDQHLLDAELALMLRRTDGSNANRLGYARRVEEALPLAFKLLDAGEITAGYVRAIEDVTANLPIELAQIVDASVADRAPTMTISGFRRLVRRVVADLDPDGQHRRQRAKRTCGARMIPQPDGMCTVGITMPATDGVATLQALNACADAIKVEDDQRTHGQRQVEALLASLFGTVVPSQPDAPDAQMSQPRRPAKRRAEIQVTIDWSTLVGLRNNPGELAGYGPVDAELVRAMLAEEGTTLRRLIHDEVTGVLLDYGRKSHDPDDHLRGLIKARDVTCRYPGCCRNAIWCEVEHCQSWDDGGSTSCANCGLMCRKHHNYKTHGGFTYTRPDPATGETVWTTPLGFVYRQKPATYDSAGIDTGDTLREVDLDDPFGPPKPRRRPPPVPLPDDPPF